jgi:hypothetical protein
MRKIEVIYYRKILGSTTYAVDVPATWNELTAKQLIQVAGLLHSKQHDIYRLRIELLRILMGFKWYHLLMLGGERLIDLFPFVDFIEKEITLTTNPISKIKARGGTLLGPVGDFSRLTADEWTDADEAYIDYRSNGLLADLDRFIAILYRPAYAYIDTYAVGDNRTPYQDHQVPNRIKTLAKVDIRIKEAVVLWYQGCRFEWESVFARVFTSKSEGPESFGWQETILKLSGAEFGNESQTLKSQMYKLMLKMEYTLKDDEWTKQQQEARNSNSRS